MYFMTSSITVRLPLHYSHYYNHLVIVTINLNSMYTIIAKAHMARLFSFFSLHKISTENPPDSLHLQKKPHATYVVTMYCYE